MGPFDSETLTDSVHIKILLILIYKNSLFYIRPILIGLYYHLRKLERIQSD